MDGVEVFIYIYIYCLPPAGGRFAPKVIKCAYGAIKGNKMRRLRRRTREGCGFSSLMKQKIKAKIYFVICFAGKKNYYFIFTL
jgi:hypothetical protein